MTTGRIVRLFAAMIILLANGGCKPLPEERHDMPIASPDRGLTVIERTGCGACHDVPGLDWPRGRLAPTLEGFADRTTIAGRLPNRPDLLATFVRDAPSLVPETTMPAIPMTRRDSRDVAAYLYTLHAR